MIYFVYGKGGEPEGGREDEEEDETTTRDPRTKKFLEDEETIGRVPTRAHGREIAATGRGVVVVDC